MTVRLENWSVIPCHVGQFLTGTVYGHDRMRDGTRVTTSLVSRVVDSTVITNSGTIYELMTMDPENVVELNDE